MPESATARCHCGGVELQATFPSRFCAHCYCWSCRTAHAAGVVTWIGFKRSQVRFTKGEELLRDYESSPGVRRKFCGRCGTRMAFESEHGDWAERTGDGHWRIFGRSDDTIKVAGKRFGPAEIEEVVLMVPGVRDAAAIGVPDPVKGSALVVMVVPADGAADPADLSAAVDAAGGLPYTRTAKLMRRAIRAVYLGDDPGDLSGMDNADGLEAVAAVKP